MEQLDLVKGLRKYAFHVQSGNPIEKYRKTVEEMKQLFRDEGLKIPQELEGLPETYRCYINQASAPDTLKLKMNTDSINEYVIMLKVEVDG